MPKFSSFALSIGAAALFTGCGGSPQVGQPGPSQPETDAASTPLPGGAVTRRGRMPLARYPQSSQPLLYVGDGSSIDIFPLTGPSQQQIGSISEGVSNPWGLSVDANKSLYVANGNATVTVYPYGSTSPSMTYSTMSRPLYALADSTGHVFVSGLNRHGVGYVVEFNAGHNRVIARQPLGTEADGIAEDAQGNLYVAYRKISGSIVEFGPGLTKKRHTGIRIDQPQGLLVDHAGNIIVVESVADRVDVFPPGTKTPSVSVTISGIGHLAELAMQNSETTLWVCSEEGFVYSMPYPLTASTVSTEYEKINGPSNGVAVTP